MNHSAPRGTQLAAHDWRISGWALGFGAVAVLASVVLPRKVVSGGPVLCPFRRVTGLSCPSCGLSRSWSALGHLQFRQSFRAHPFGPPFLAAFAVGLFRSRHGPGKGLDLAQLSAGERKLAAVVAGVWLAWALVRAARELLSGEKR